MSCLEGQSRTFKNGLSNDLTIILRKPDYDSLELTGTEEYEKCQYSMCFIHNWGKSILTLEGPLK